MQLLPALNVGGVERGTIEIAAALVNAGHRALVVSAGGRLCAELESVGAQHIELDIGAKKLSTLRLVQQLRREIVTHKVDIVHARSRLPAWIGHFAIRGIKPSQQPAWVTTVHGPYTVNAYSRIMTSGIRVIAISEFIRDYIESNYPRVENKRVTVIPRGVDTDHYPRDYCAAPAWRAKFESHYPQTAGKRLLIIAARLTRWKGQTAFLEMLQQVIAERQDVHGLIAGGSGNNDRFEQELRGIIVERGLEHAVSFVGARQDLRDLFAHCDIAYSLTSVPEAFGRTTIEALSLGTPVIGFDHGGTAEILRRVFPAGLVKVGDIKAAAERTLSLLDRTPPIAREHPYTVTQLQQRTLALYAELVGST